MKKYLFSLLLFFGLGLSFCSAGTYTFSGTLNSSINSIPRVVVPQTQYSKYIYLHCDFNDYGNYGGTCLKFNIGYNFNYSDTSSYYYFSTPTVELSCQGDLIYDYDFGNWAAPSYASNFWGFNYIDFRFSFINSSSFIDYVCVLTGDYIQSFGGSCPTCPSQYTSEECQTEYNLVPSSDLSSCQSSLSGCQTSLSGRNNTLNNCSNNLLSCESSLSSCIQSNCPFDTGSVQWSALWINGIQHLGKPVINIDIPGQIYWDYTTDDEEFNLYVGSGYDQEYIDNVIAINSYQPTSEDFTSIFVGGLTLIFPYIFIGLLVLFIRKLVKRIFK